MSDSLWMNRFAKVLNTAMELFGITVSDIAADYCDYSSVVKWREGKRLPYDASMVHLLSVLKKKIEASDGEHLYAAACTQIEIDFADDDLTRIKTIETECGKSSYKLLEAVLHLCLLNGRRHVKKGDALPSTTVNARHFWVRAVFFDFDGTLTQDKVNRTTWEDLWNALGYDVSICREYQKQFTEKKIDHDEWCQITEEYFKKRNLHRETIERIADQIKLLPGTREVFEILDKSGVKIFIVSGSIFQIIRRCMKECFLYLDGIKANNFDFDEAGYLRRIIGTKYDFEGKADYIRLMSADFDIPIDQMLFIGNSMNDRFANESGIRTLCINPRETDYRNAEIWNNYIESCTDLKQILPYLVN